jgi:hypothetical protein
MSCACDYLPARLGSGAHLRNAFPLASKPGRAGMRALFSIGSRSRRRKSPSRALDSVHSTVASYALASGAARTVWYGPSRPAWHSKSNHYAWQLIVANRVPLHRLHSRSWLVAGIGAASTPEGVSALGGVSGNRPLSFTERFTVELSGQARECGVMSDGIPCASGLRGQDPSGVESAPMPATNRDHPGARKSGSWALMRSGSTAPSTLTTNGEAALNR